MRIAILLLFLLTTTASAQTLGDYLGRFEFGFGHSTLNTARPLEDGEDPDSTSLSDTYAGWMVSVGWNWPIVKIAQDVGIGVTASGRFVFSTPSNDDPYDSGTWNIAIPNSQSDGDFEPHVTIPIYAMLKYGTDAHWGWRQPFGAALGLGYQFEYHDADVEYWAPLAIAELSIAAQAIRGVIKLQYQHAFGRTSFPSEYYPEGKTAESWSVALLYAVHFGPQLKSEEEKNR